MSMVTETQLVETARELAKLRRKGMFGLLTEQDLSRWARLTVRMETLVAGAQPDERVLAALRLRVQQ